MIGKILYLRQHYHFGPQKISMYLKRYHDLYNAYLVQTEGNAPAALSTDNPYPPLLLDQFASNNFSAVQPSPSPPPSTASCNRQLHQHDDH